MASEDLKQYASSEQDFYALLGVEFERSEADIKRAYRKAVLKYHPDKNPGNPNATVEKFHLVQTAYAVLTDAAAKAAYDGARSAREARQKQKALFEGKRRRMAEDLERRERGVKRGRGDGEGEAEDDAEERLAREIRRLGEEGKRRRMQRDEKIRRESMGVFVEREQESVQTSETRDSEPEKIATSTGLPDTTGTEIDRTIKARWPREGSGHDLGKEELGPLFSRFGRVENVIPIKDKRLRVGERREKKTMATACIVFESVTAARAAVAGAKGLSEAPWPLFESVLFAADNKTDGTLSAAATPVSTPKPPRASPLVGSSTSTPSGGSPGFEATMERLRLAEKKRLEDEIRRRGEMGLEGARGEEDAKGNEGVGNINGAVAA
ncbi:MAG: hypothetical protein M1832_004259 [Thelocarpon impressellum]|nr:MAG: hypothetical protein M1832_004259 [Thelocarpon impressellum]